MTQFLMFLFVTEGLVLIGLSVPLIRQMVPPNPWYGFRVPRTLNNPELWYPTNAYVAWRLLWVGVATMFTAVAGYLIPGVSLDIYATIVGAVAVSGLIIAVLQSFRYLATLSSSPTDSDRN